MTEDPDRDLKLCDAGIAYGQYANSAVLFAHALKGTADPGSARVRLVDAAGALRKILFRAGVDAVVPTDFQTSDEILTAFNAQLLTTLGDTICRALGERSEWVFLLTALIGGAITASATGLPKELVQPILGNAKTIAAKISIPEGVVDRCVTEKSWDPLKAFLFDRRSGSRKVFLVHGRNEAALHSVARFLSQVGLSPVVLREQPSRGRAIIEKFIHYSDVEFAVVLLTSDDVGALAQDAPGALRRRARQNVIMELGFFLGKLGRDRVCALHEPEVEVPSDYAGVVFVPLDSGGAWRIALGKELRAAGLEIDLNAI